MRPRSRTLLAGVVALVGVPVALVFGGGGVAMCLGPLDVTEVECAKQTGLHSNVGLGAPGLALVLALALFVLVPVAARDRLLAVGATVAGALTAAVAFLVLWPTTLDGFDSKGQWLSVPRPLDAWALLTAIVAGAALGFALRAVLAVLRPLRTGT